MSNSIRIKRRAASGDSGAPASLKNGELAYNEADNNLYYGFGDNGSGVATSVPIIGGVLDNLLQDIADISGTATAANQVIVSTGSGAFALESGSTLRTSLGVDAAGTDNSTDVTLAGTPDYITISGQVITRHKIDLNNGNDVSGTLPSGNLPVATATAKGAIELFSNTAQTETSNSVSATSGRTYGIQLNSAGQAVVNVPWTDTNTQTPVRTVVVGGHTLDSSETLTLTSGENVTLTESNGQVTFAASRRPVTAGGNTLANGETLAFTAGDNITISESGGAVTIASNASATRDSLGIDTDDDVVFRTLELGGASNTATIKAPAELVLDPAAHGNATGTVKIAGNLQVDGTTTTVNSTVVEIADLAIDLAPSATSSSAINGGGFRIGTLSSSEAVVSFQYVHTDTRMVLSSAMKISGGLEDTVIDGGTF